MKVPRGAKKAVNPRTPRGGDARRSCSRSQVDYRQAVSPTMAAHVGQSLEGAKLQQSPLRPGEPAEHSRSPAGRASTTGLGERKATPPRPVWCNALLCSPLNVPLISWRPSGSACEDWKPASKVHARS